MHSRSHTEMISSIHDDWPPPHHHKLWFKSRRLIIFVITFLTCASLTLSYVFSRPAVYLSYATLLTVSKTAIDLPSSDADIQHVAIQKQVLLGSELLAETSRRLKSGNNSGLRIDLSTAEIRHMLDVRPVAETNLVEMIAEGPDPEKLPVLINTWIEVYLNARSKEVARLLGDTTQIIQEELAGLAEKITVKRIELDQFRKNNDISSIEREENEALARLKGLNDSFNLANEEEIKTKARLDAINKAIARGQAVVPQEDTRTLSLLENRAQQLREELSELSRRYTQEYMDLSPTLRVIPEQLASLEDEIRRLRQSGQTIVRSDAEQAYAAARQATSEIRRQLDDHKKKAAEFSSRFAEHKALQTDLEGLELLYRETQERLIQIETKYAGKYPQVDVIERAFLPSTPIRPNYPVDAMIAVAVSIVFSLFCIWISEFLTRKAQPKPVINLSGIHLYDNDLPVNVLRNPQHSIEALPHRNTVLEKTPAREISAQKIKILLRSAGNKEKLLIALLLSGVTLEEIAAIKQEDVDFENEKLTIKDISPRTIPLSPALKKLFAMPSSRLITLSGEPLSIEDLAALLSCAINDADLSAADEISADSLRQTYIIYLVKQGVRLSELANLAGYMPPTQLSGYSVYSPPGPKHSLVDIDVLYPELREITPASQ